MRASATRAGNPNPNPNPNPNAHQVRRSEAYLAARSQVKWPVAAPGLGSTLSRPLRRRLLLAAAIAEETHWRPYEHANLSLSMHQTLSLPDVKAGAEASRGE